MLMLSVNVNKVATLRNSRGANIPCLEDVTKDIIHFGARSITIHPRPDERHIKKSDVFSLKKLIYLINESHEKSDKSGMKKGRDKKVKFFVELNIEGFPNWDFLRLIESARPSQCTLVPDPPEALTSSAGWELFNNKTFLKSRIEKLRELKIRSSLFIDPLLFLKDLNEKKSLLEINPDRVEIYTGVYAKSFKNQKQNKILEIYKKFENFLNENSSIGINAGHDLNEKNLKPLIQSIPSIKEVSIGHSLISEALYEGLEKTIKKYLKICKR